MLPTFSKLLLPFKYLPESLINVFFTAILAFYTCWSFLIIFFFFRSSRISIIITTHVDITKFPIDFFTIFIISIDWWLQ